MVALKKLREMNDVRGGVFLRKLFECHFSQTSCYRVGGAALDREIRTASREEIGTVDWVKVGSGVAVGDGIAALSGHIFGVRR
jgi:hypothetical protein